MIAIVLCAGFGTRLHPLTKNTPKALLPVAGKPALDYLMPQLLEMESLTAVHLVANARFFGQFYTWAQQWSEPFEARGVRLHLYNDGSLEEAQRLGSVGDLAFVLRTIGEPGRALVVADDTIFRFPLKPVAATFMQSADRNYVLALPEQNYQLRQRLTVMELAEDDRVLRLHEYPEAPPTEWVCPMLYFLQPQTLASIEPYLKEAQGEKDSLPRLMDYVLDREPTYAVRMPQPTETRTWFDIETRYMYNRANEVLGQEPLMVKV